MHKKKIGSVTMKWRNMLEKEKKQSYLRGWKEKVPNKEGLA